MSSAPEIKDRSQLLVARLFVLDPQCIVVDALNAVDAAVPEEDEQLDLVLGIGEMNEHEPRDGRNRFDNCMHEPGRREVGSLRAPLVGDIALCGSRFLVPRRRRGCHRPQKGHAWSAQARRTCGRSRCRSRDRARPAQWVIDASVDPRVSHKGRQPRFQLEHFYALSSLGGSGGSPDSVSIKCFGATASRIGSSAMRGSRGSRPRSWRISSHS